MARETQPSVFGSRFGKDSFGSNPFGTSSKPAVKRSQQPPMKMAEFPGTQVGPFGRAKSENKGVEVNPFMEDLADLLASFPKGASFSKDIENLVLNWQGTARVRELVQFGANYHRMGSVVDAVEQMWSSIKTTPVEIRHPTGSTEGDVFGIIGRRMIAGKRPVLDCVMATDYGFTLATMMQSAEGELRFVARKGFVPGKPAERTIEEAVVPLCKRK